MVSGWLSLEQVSVVVEAFLSKHVYEFKPSSMPEAPPDPLSLLSAIIFNYYKQ